MSNTDKPSPGADGPGGGRRKGDRRQREVPFEGEERRKDERRSGTDRRASPREDGAS
jgi:hypothetical protein